MPVADAAKHTVAPLLKVGTARRRSNTLINTGGCLWCAYA